MIPFLEQYGFAVYTDRAGAHLCYMAEDELREITRPTLGDIYRLAADLIAGKMEVAA